MKSFLIAVLAAGSPLAVSATPLPLVRELVLAAAPAAVETKVAIPVDGMTCAACPVAIKTALKKLDGVKSAEASREKKQAEVVYDESKVTAEQLAEAINKLGYKAGTPKRVP